MTLQVTIESGSDYNDSHLPLMNSLSGSQSVCGVYGSVPWIYEGKVTVLFLTIPGSRVFSLFAARPDVPHSELWSLYIPRGLEHVNYRAVHARFTFILASRWGLVPFKFE